MGGPLALVSPVLAQLLLTLVLIVWSGRVRLAAVRSRQVAIADIALSGDAWPPGVRKISNNVQNQFETPVLFYVLCGLATYLGATGILMTVLAWAYVATRVVHSAVHVTSNDVVQRFRAFVCGVVILAIMWCVVATRVVTGFGS